MHFYVTTSIKLFPISADSKFLILSLQQFFPNILLAEKMLSLYFLLALRRELQRRKPTSHRIQLAVLLQVMEISGDRVF